MEFFSKLLNSGTHPSLMYFILACFLIYLTNLDGNIQEKIPSWICLFSKSMPYSFSGGQLSYLFLDNKLVKNLQRQYLSTIFFLFIYSSSSSIVFFSFFSFSPSSSSSLFFFSVFSSSYSPSPPLLVSVIWFVIARPLLAPVNNW